MQARSKVSYKKLFAIYAIIISSGSINADITSNINGGDPKKSLSSLHDDIANLATPDDSSGIYTFLNTTIPGNITTATSALATSAALTSAISALTNSITIAIKPIATSADLSNAVTSITSTITTATSPLATSAALTSAVSTITNSIATATNPLATSNAFSNATSQLATSAALTSAVSTIVNNITNLGTTSDVSGLYALLTLIVANLQLDPIAQVKSAAKNAALNPVSTKSSSAANNVSKYNNDLTSALTAVSTAIQFSSQSNANTTLALTAVNQAITSFTKLAIQLNGDKAVPSSSYSIAQINGALNQLKYALSYLLTQQPAS